MNTEAVKKNYSVLGSALIEKLYSADYLSIGGTASTDSLAEHAAISENSRVLDVGSGLGGPALHLAANRKCRVTGLDLVETNVSEANRRAHERGLQDLVNFQTGNAIDMPFKSGSFDVVWGQDAWCHVPDKAALIAESARILGPTGRIAFTDWVRMAEMDAAQSAEIHEATASSNMATLAQYQELLVGNGLTVIHQEDISAAFIDQYRTIMARLKAVEAELTDRYGAKIFRVMQDKNGSILQAFEEGLIGGGRIVASCTEGAKGL